MTGLSIYGTVKRIKTAKKHVKKWSYHHKGPQKGKRWYKRRITKKVTQKVGKPIHQKRFTFYGTTKDIRKAKNIMNKERLIPRAVFPRYEDGLDAARFWSDKRYRKRHSIKGEWIESEEVETP